MEERIRELQKEIDRMDNRITTLEQKCFDLKLTEVKTIAGFERLAESIKEGLRNIDEKYSPTKNLVYAIMMLLAAGIITGVLQMLIK